MGARFPTKTGKEMDRIIRKFCTLTHQKGSHRTFERDDGTGTPFTFSYHDGAIVPGGKVRRTLLNDVGLSIEQAEREVGMR
ncbi:type II toxin-antitoxin system HicA family toxin [Mycobacterium marinum]|uniref:type II toxin-antitoxin system HicA family toxin n=1 Tax=Mycobacterium marinum TaxID=1781 RepID=UPI00235A3253|nr:type II toxin-antitoxin system HicA family toxin [Mycobacterium marinum]MDC8974653.1 type II toxin-antitoxin system HicA family toxin [Mycobacterium marinum]